MRGLIKLTAFAFLLTSFQTEAFAGNSKDAVAVPLALEIRCDMTSFDYRADQSVQLLKLETCTRRNTNEVYFSTNCNGREEVYLSFSGRDQDGRELEMRVAGYTEYVPYSFSEGADLFQEINAETTTTMRERVDNDQRFSRVFSRERRSLLDLTTGGEYMLSAQTYFNTPVTSRSIMTYCTRKLHYTR